MKKLLLSSATALGLLVASPAMAQCYCSLYSSDGGCADMTCYNDYNYGSYDPYYDPYYIPPTRYVPNNTSSSTSDVSIDVTVDDSSAEPGDSVTFTLKLRNNRNSNQTTDVRAVLSRDLTFVSASAGGDEEDNEVRWDNVRVPSRSTKTLTMRVRIRSSADDGDRLEVRAYTNRTSDSATVRVDDEDNDLNDADLRVILSDSPDPVQSGDTLTYTIRIENESNDDLEDIRVRAELDEDTSFLSATDGGDEDNDEVEWDRIDIDEDEEETLILRVRVRSGVRSGDTLRLRVEVEGEDETISTRVGSGSSNSGTCTYYNSYLQQYYIDYCDERHETSGR